jgi:hypothetical protein
LTLAKIREKPSTLMAPSKYKAVTKIALEMVVRFTWAKRVLCVYDGAIVDSQPFYREKVGGIICGLCGGQRPVGRFMLECTVEATITGSH